MLILNKQCPGCGTVNPAICSNCVQSMRSQRFYSQVSDVDQFSCLGEYSGVVRPVILALKSGRRDLLAPLAALLSELVADYRCDLVTWVPSSIKGRRVRGFDQSKGLAKHVARHLGTRSQQTMLRQGSSRQTGGSRFERLHGPQLVAKGLHSGHVILIDDVVTTGASMSSAARILKQVGVQSIVGLSLASVDR